MSLEYIALMDCPINQSMEMGEFHCNLQMYRHCRGLHSYFQSQGKSREEIMAISVQGVRRVLGKVKQQDKPMTLGEMVEQLKPFVAAGREHCARCPLAEGCSEGVFGCYGAVNYPLTTRGEAWLMERFAGYGGGEDSFILGLIRDNKITGKKVSKGRPGGLLFKRQAILFEGERAVTVNIGGRRGPAVNADQLLELILGLGTWQPHVMLNFLKDFGAIDASLADGAEQELAIGMLLAMAGEKVKTPPSGNGPGAFLMEAEAGEDATIAQFRRFFHVMYKAYNQHVPFATNG